MAEKKSNIDFVAIVGVTISVLVLLYGAVVMPMQQRKAALENPPAEQRQTVQNPVAQQPTQTTAVEQTQSTPEVSLNNPLLAPQDMSTPWIRKSSDSKRISANDNMFLEIAADGTGCISVELPEYKEEIAKGGADDAKNVVLGNSDYPFMALIPSNNEYALTNVVSAESSDVSYTLERASANGRLIVKETWKVDDSYQVSYRIDVRNATENDVVLSGFRVEAGAMPPSVSKGRKAGRGESAGGLSFASDGTHSDVLAMGKLTKLKSDERARLAATPMYWSAVHSKYFMLSLWMKEGFFAGLECGTVPSVSENGMPSLPDGRYHARVVLPNLNIPAGGTASWELEGYAGPKDFERLASYGKGLESVMDLDRFFFWRPIWMRYLSRYLLKMLVAISGWFPKSIGYGLAVILLTIVVKLVFWPLSHKSTLSMRKMQALKPQLDTIKEKYKNDPTTMYRKQQELFKANNVSQLGGCLPMLLQIPVFFALFSTFRNAIQLRHASFLWAYDLSMPDTLPFALIPIRPFAILMAATMFLQQKMTPNPDPQQSKMMTFMTIFFMFLFYSMPSALTLYLTVSYLLGILQTYMTNKMLPPVQTVTK